jgi:arylsulfatase A-like enzyme
MKRRDFLKRGAAALVGGLSSTSAGWQRLFGDGVAPSSGTKPNLLFVMADQWRWHAQGHVGMDPVSTPNLDAFAARALSFRNAITTQPICAPNRACLFTGLYPPNHKVYTNEENLLNPELASLGKVLKADGYKTGYFGKFHLGGTDEMKEGVPPGPARHGWDDWLMNVGHQPFHQGMFLQDETDKTYMTKWEPTYLGDKAVEFLNQQKGSADPFALVISFGPPHTGGGPGFEDRFLPGKPGPDGKPHFGYGYAAPKEYEAAYRPAEKLPRRPNVAPCRGMSSTEAQPGYFGAITSIDESFGRMIAQLEANGQIDNTLIVFTSDHGEMMGSQGRMTKGIFFEEAIRVPLMISWGDRIKPREEASLVSTIDIMPSLLGLMNVPLPANLDGKDLSSFIAGKSSTTRDAAFLSYGEQNIPQNGWRAIRTDKYCYALTAGAFLHSPGVRQKDGRVLYDLDEDPYEMHPIFLGDGQDEVINQLHQRLTDHLDSLHDPFLKPMLPGQKPEKERDS